MHGGGVNVAVVHGFVAAVILNSHATRADRNVCAWLCMAGVEFEVSRESSGWYTSELLQLRSSQSVRTCG